MSALTHVFLLLACITLALGFHVQPRAKRDTADSSTLDSTSSSSDGTDATSALSNPVSSIISGAQNVASRVQDAINSTYQEEKSSVSDSWNNVKELIHQNIETGANLTKTAFDLGTIFPKFGKNLIIGSNN